MRKWSWNHWKLSFALPHLFSTESRSFWKLKSVFIIWSSVVIFLSFNHDILNFAINGLFKNDVPRVRRGVPKISDENWERGGGGTCKQWHHHQKRLCTSFDFVLGTFKHGFLVLFKMVTFRPPESYCSQNIYINHKDVLWHVRAKEKNIFFFFFFFCCRCLV